MQRGLLRDLVSGRRFAIQLDTAPIGTSCHLDASGIGEACATLLPQIAAADVVILSKFGKIEAVQQGLWEAFTSTVAKGKPLLTTVSTRYVEAWMAFAPQAAWLEPDSRSIEQWWGDARSRSRDRDPR